MHAVPVLLRTLVVACAACALATACKPAPDKSGRFSSALGRTLASPSAGSVDLSGIDAPAWDELYVFGPGTAREENCRILDLGWLECRTTLPTVVADGEDFLVFRVKGRIARAERHALSNGDFVSGDAPLPQPIPRSASKFKVAAAQEPRGAGVARRRLEYQG